MFYDSAPPITLKRIQTDSVLENVDPLLDVGCRSTSYSCAIEVKPSPGPGT